MMEKSAMTAAEEVIQEIMRIRRSLPARVGIEEVKAARTLIANMEREDQSRIKAISRQTKGKSIPEELFKIYKELQRSMVYFNRKDQMREPMKVLDLEKNIHSVFDDLILRASKWLSSPSSSSASNANTSSNNELVSNSGGYLRYSSYAASLSSYGKNLNSYSPVTTTTTTTSMSNNAASLAIYSEKEAVRPSVMMSKDDSYVKKSKGLILADGYGAGLRSRELSAQPQINDSTLKPAINIVLRMEKSAMMAAEEVVQEIMRVHRSLPARPGIEEVEAARTLIANVEREDQSRIEAISRQTKGKSVPEELLKIYKEMQMSMVYLNGREQMMETMKVLDLENIHSVFDDLIPRASKCLSSLSSSSMSNAITSSNNELVSNSGGYLRYSSYAASLSSYSEKEVVRPSVMMSKDDSYVKKSKGSILADGFGAGLRSMELSAQPQIVDSTLKPAINVDTQPKAPYLFNVLTGTLEELAKKKQVRLYGTGFNARAPAYIGIARLYVGIDVLLRYLKFLGYEVQYIRPMNDLYKDFSVPFDDTVDEQLPEYYCSLLEEDLRSINCISPELAPRLSRSLNRSQLELELEGSKGIPKFHKEDFRDDHFFSTMMNKSSFDIHGDWSRGPGDQSNRRQSDLTRIKYWAGCAPIELATAYTLTVANLIEVHSYDPLCVRFFLLYKGHEQLSEQEFLEEVEKVPQRLINLYKILETSSGMSKLKSTSDVSYHCSVGVEALETFRIEFLNMARIWNKPHILIRALLTARKEFEKCLRDVEATKVGLVQPLIELRGDMMATMEILGLLPSDRSITQAVADIERCRVTAQEEKEVEKMLKREEAARRQLPQREPSYPELLTPPRARSHLVVADNSPPPPPLRPPRFTDHWSYFDR